MDDFRKNLKDNLARTAEFLKKSSEEAAIKIKEGVDKMGNIGPATLNKAADVVNELLAVLPLLEEAGYPAQEFKIGLALSPVIEINFLMGYELEEEALEAMKEKHEDKRLFGMLLGTLKMARDLSGKIKSDDFGFEETVVEITVPPKVSLRYVNKRSAFAEAFHIEEE